MPVALARRTNTNACRIHGFTLVELAVTMTVAAVLFALAVPSFRAFFDKARLRSTADEVVDLVSHARANAVKHNLDVTIRAKGSGAAWCFGANQATQPAATQPMPASSPCDCSSSPSACMVDGQQLTVLGAEHDGVLLTATPSDFVIDGNMGTQAGALASVPIDMTTASGRFAVHLDIAPLGQVRACVPAGKAVISGYPSCN